MNSEETLELFRLSILVQDTLIMRRLNNNTVDNILKRYTHLIDKVIETYKLPENSDKDSVKN